MDDQAVIRSYGNTNLPEGTRDRPLVTFALFAYNQEKYIQEAVEGAFSQTYSPLEIILSDDCSSDRTFKIMEEMARKYQGPHLVRVRQSEVNLGTAVHVCVVGRNTNGSLLVVAAGDDISVPTRTKSIVECWNSHSCPTGTLHSGMYLFGDGDPSKKQSEIGPRSRGVKRIELSEYAKDRQQYFWAPTCAYTSDLFKRFPPMIGGSIIEDGVMNSRTVLSGVFISIGDALVHVRKSKESGGAGYCISNPSRWNNFIHSKMVSLRTSSRDLSAFAQSADSKVAAECRSLEKKYANLYSNLSKFILPEIGHYGLIERAFLFFRLLRFPGKRKLIDRISFVYAFLGLHEAPLFEWLVKRLKQIRGNRRDQMKRGEEI
ncbi:glycosyltransferase family 2 protein [Ancylobacter polymorphus]|uniref:Glycosyltransferase family 2 protein n=1 Tax=Ancylobacter polymorphus TaxID=223390 RepID=A0A9E7D5H4_9HYPH|nr:glycosyltransferase family A protein [Ancylobacter polymorphus]UOK72802.1 glycosyltransferase family 2 protein [Ancylobacter polymorphus]